MIVCPDCREPITRIVFMEIGECSTHGMVRWQRDTNDYRCPECDRPYELTITTTEERDAALAAIRAHDAARGWIVPLPGYDHVHRVTPDEQGTGE